VLRLDEAEKRVVEAFRKALDVARAIVECRREYSGLLGGLEGGFVEPGPAGSLTRGRTDILPTGRNFYSVDPTTLPTRAAWEVGVRAVDRMLRAYLEKHGRYPETVGHVLWSIDAYKADGEQLAQILYLLGVSPVWGRGGRVVGLEVIPLERLGRPRIDCLVRISGIVRDTLPNYVYLIDEAVSKVVSLDEPAEENYPKKHYEEHLRKLVELGRGVKAASRLARLRVYSSPPGSYGAGVNYAVEASAWRTEEDLAKTWVQWSCYAYSRDAYGEKAPDALILGMKTVDIVARTHISDEHDLLACCCYYAHHGGFYGAVKALTGRDDVEAFIVDSREVTHVEVRDVKLEVERVVRAKLLNPAWIEEMKRHGYRGASEFTKKLLHLYGWSATARVVDDWVFEEIAKTYVLDEDMRRWFEENNVYALEEIARRLLEAAERGLWKAPRDLVERLREVYGEVEAMLEEEAGNSDIQGGVINIYTAEDVEAWRERTREVADAWRKLKGGG